MQHVPRSCSIELAAAEPHLDGLTTAGGREGSFQHICGASDGNREVVRPFRGPGAVSAVAKTSCSRILPEERSHAAPPLAVAYEHRCRMVNNAAAGTPGSEHEAIPIHPVETEARCRRGGGDGGCHSSARWLVGSRVSRGAISSFLRLVPRAVARGASSSIDAGSGRQKISDQNLSEFSK